VRVPMTSRNRLLITATLVCHLLLAHPLVTSQLLAPETKANPAQSLPNLPSAPKEEEVTITATTQEKIGSIYKLHGKVEIHYGVYILLGNEVTYNADTGEAAADGHVVLEGGPNDEHIQANHGTYNVRTESGRFENVTGSIGVRTRGTRLALTSSNPFFFTGKVVEKTGPDHYMVYDGTVTTCELPRPRWQFNANKVVVTSEERPRFTTAHSGFAAFPFFIFPSQPCPHSGFHGNLDF